MAQEHPHSTVPKGSLFPASQIYTPSCAPHSSGCGTGAPSPALVSWTKSAPQPLPRHQSPPVPGWTFHPSHPPDGWDKPLGSRPGLLLLEPRLESPGHLVRGHIQTQRVWGTPEILDVYAAGLWTTACELSTPLCTKRLPWHPSALGEAPSKTNSMLSKPSRIFPCSCSQVLFPSQNGSRVPPFLSASAAARPSRPSTWNALATCLWSSKPRPASFKTGRGSGANTLGSDSSPVPEQ